MTSHSLPMQHLDSETKGHQNQNLNLIVHLHLYVIVMVHPFGHSSCTYIHRTSLLLIETKRRAPPAVRYVKKNIWIRCCPPASLTASSHGVLVRPSPGGGLVPESVGLAHVGDLRDERVVRVGVGEQRADGEQHLGDRQGRAPLLLEDVQADVPVAVDVRVEHLRLERYLHFMDSFFSSVDRQR